jgi:diaminopropionate ammonia-lyase
MNQASTWFLRPAARSWQCAPPSTAARRFHASFPEYLPTPLRDVPALARELHVARVFVKDESSRLGLPAFKMLGASWAVARLVGERAGIAQPTLDQLQRLDLDGTRLVTATDGNHGRAVARMARLLNVPATIFVPSVTSPAAADAIAGEGADLLRVDGDYDQAVRNAADYVRDERGAELVQDTAWEGYEQVPAWIVEGYETLLSETDEQLAAASAVPSLIAVPTGVGSLLQAVIAHYRGPSSAFRPTILSVEPDSAACALASLAAGERTSVETDATVMAGLNCGSISTAAWPYIRDGLDAAIAVTDADALRAVEDLRAAGVSSGPSGAATLAGARGALTSEARRAELGVTRESVVVLINTEEEVAHDRTGA